MSEDDADMLNAGEHGSAQVDRDRRAPRFSWTPAYEATFFRSLCESVQLGLRENSSFKAEAWERAAQALQESHGACPTKSHLINKSDNARKRFRLWRGLREDPEFAYNPLTRTVSASEEAWRAHIEREPLSRALRGRPFDHEDYMEVLYPDVVGSGGAPKRIMKPRRRTDGTVGDEPEMPGTGILNLQPEAPTAQQAAPDSPSQQRPPLSQTPSGSSTTSQQRPTSTAIPPRTATASTSALTPPDETASHNRKRPLSTRANQPAVVDTMRLASSTTPAYSVSQSSSPDKRRRTSSRGDAVPIEPSAPAASSSFATVPAASSTAPVSSASRPDERSSESRPVLEELLDVLKGGATARWREEALDLLFQGFANEELDVQLNISETLASSDSKAMLFCKMPDRVRRHWIKRSREAYGVRPT